MTMDAETPESAAPLLGPQVPLVNRRAEAALDADANPYHPPQTVQEPVNDGDVAAPAVEEHHGQQGLLSRSFLALLATQFLVALNDNMFRWLIVPIGMSLVPKEQATFVMSAGLACFVLPYLVLAAPAGYVADRFSKRNVIVACKIAEVVIMALGVVTILIGNLYLMLAMVALMGAQSAMFGPSKLGAIPEIVRSDRISAANGYVGMTTVLAIIVGTVAGNFLFAWTTLNSGETLLSAPGCHQWWISAAALIGVASLGLLTCLLIGRLRQANPSRRFPVNPVGQTVRDLKTLTSNRPLLWTALGAVYFWSLGALCQMNIDLFGKTILGVEQQHIGPLLAVLAAGIGLGSVLAGLWSSGRIELGMVPFGAAGIALFAGLLFTVPLGNGGLDSPAYIIGCVWLAMLGISGGLFDIPLQSFLQERSPEKSRGSILAASNFLTFSGMLVAAGLFWLLSGPLGLSASQIFLCCGLLTLVMVPLIVWRLPLETVRFTIWIISRLIYRVQVRGRENLPADGGALLIPNHVSWIDGLLLGLACPRHVRMVAFADYFQGRLLGSFARLTGIITIKPGKRSVVDSVRQARKILGQGEFVCIFPEGGITRDGEMREFRPGFLSILKNTDAPVIPVYLGGLWGSIFSFEGGKFFWKWPRKWPYPVTISFGEPMYTPEDVDEVRRAVESLGEMDEQ